MNPTELTLDFKVPVVVTENSVILSKSNGTVVIAFLQFNNLKEPANSHVVAAIELKDLSKLEELKKSIEDHIKKEKTREP